MSKKGFSKGLWCVAGDFNVVLKGNERKGVSVHDYRVEIEEFQAIVRDMELFDLPLLGRRYRWFKQNGSAMSGWIGFYYRKNG